MVNSIGIIPARGGSVGVKRKNIRIVGGIPLINYSIKAAKKSEYLTDFFVSTEDQDIADIAREAGGKIIDRPKEIAENDTPMFPILLHAMDYLNKLLDYSIDQFVLLQPTTPLRTEDDIDKSIKTINTSNADTLISVYEVEDTHPSRMYTIVKNRLIPYAEEPRGSLRQDLPSVFHRNGAIYIVKTEILVNKKSIIGNKIIPYVMPRSRSINIDDEYDLQVADLLLSDSKDL